MLACQRQTQMKEGVKSRAIVIILRMDENKGKRVKFYPDFC